MKYSDFKEQIAKGYLSWNEILKLRNIFPKNRRDLKITVIKRNIPWWMPCKNWIAKRIEKKIN